MAAVTLAVGTLGAFAANGGPGDKHRPPKPIEPVHFGVISDPHLYSTRLGVEGAAFEAYLDRDPKLLRESEAILDAAIDSMIRERVRFVIIPGDLTKDGELVNHLQMARHLARLEQQRIQVFVVPGNHDLNNPDAVSFFGDVTRPVGTTNARQFRAIYQRFGFDLAIDRAPDSLSYLAEPAPGLWLLAIDSTDSGRNKLLGYPEVGGKISPATMAWTLAKLRQANDRGKRVIAFMHHGVNPNSAAEPTLFPDFLVDDWNAVGERLSANGLKVVFTGHYHAQDAGFSPSGLCDVETSSLVGFPCAYRVVTVQPDGEMDIRSQRVTAIKADTGGLPFQEFALNFMQARLPALAAYQLETQFGLPAEQAAALAPLVAGTLIAGYAGDELPDTQTQETVAWFIANPEPFHSFGMLLYALWADPPPGDNELVLDLNGM